MALPTYEPMLATNWPAIFDHPDWWFELKWDGIRVVVEADADGVRLRSRQGKVMTEAYPELSAWSATTQRVYDGEIVAFDESGNPSFSQLQQRMNATGARAREAAGTNPVTLIVFDMLHDGAPITDLPIEDRRSRLAEALPPGAVVAAPTLEHGSALFTAVIERGLEGVVAKRAGSSYQPGRRSPDWRKIVHRRSSRFVVGGYLPGEGVRWATFGSLVLGLWVGERLRFVGSVGSGFDDAQLGHIRRALDELAAPSSPFEPDGAIPRSVRWVEPSLVTVVEFREWTHDSHLRAPVFKGLTIEPVESITWDAEGPG
jgi:bifunctional non-homologous end joining protein LigD